MAEGCCGLPRTEHCELSTREEPSHHIEVVVDRLVAVERASPIAGLTEIRLAHLPENGAMAWPWWRGWLLQGG